MGTRLRNDIVSSTIRKLTGSGNLYSRVYGGSLKLVLLGQKSPINL